MSYVLVQMCALYPIIETWRVYVSKYILSCSMVLRIRSVTFSFIALINGKVANLYTTISIELGVQGNRDGIPYQPFIIKHSNWLHIILINILVILNALEISTRSTIVYCV